MFLLALLSSALLGPVIALPSASPQTCDKKTTVNFKDIKNVTPGAPSVLSPSVPNPYHGLNYGSGWGLTRSLDSKTTKLLISPQRAIRGPYNIAADKASGTLSYGLSEFQWSGQLPSAGPTTPIGLNTTLNMDGTTDKGVKVHATCDYVVPLVAVGGPTLPPPPPQTCTLPATFVYVKDVVFSVASAVVADGQLRVAAITELTYVLHTCKRS